MADNQDFSPDDLIVESEFADLYANSATAAERLSRFWKVQTVVSDNLSKIAELFQRHEPTKLHFADDGHIECDESSSVQRGFRGVALRLFSGNDPDNIRNLAIFVVFLNKHYVDYRQDNAHMEQEVRRLEAAKVGLQTLSKLYLDEMKNENLDILNKSVHQLELCIQAVNRKIDENNALTFPQLRGVLEEVLVKLKLTASDSRNVQIAGLAQTIQAYDGLNVTRRTTEITDDFGLFAKCIEKLSVGSKAEEYLLKELLLAEYFMMNVEIISPVEEELNIGQFRQDLQAFQKGSDVCKMEFAQLQADVKAGKRTLDDKMSVSDGSGNREIQVIDLYIQLEEKIKNFETAIKEKEEQLLNAESKFPEGIKTLIAKREALIKDLNNIKESYGDDTKNLQALSFIKTSGLFPESLKLMGNSLELPLSQSSSSEEATSSLQKGAQLVAGIAITGFAFYNPALAAVAMPVGVGLMKGALGGVDSPYIKQAEAILEKAQDPKKAREEIQLLVKQAGDNTQLVGEIWSVYNKYLG